MSRFLRKKQDNIVCLLIENKKLMNFIKII